MTPETRSTQQAEIFRGSEDANPVSFEIGSFLFSPSIFGVAVLALLCGVDFLQDANRFVRVTRLYPKPKRNALSSSLLQSIDAKARSHLWKTSQSSDFDEHRPLSAQENRRAQGPPTVQDSRDDFAREG